MICKVDYALGLFLITVVFINIYFIAKYSSLQTETLLWYCDLATLILAISILFKNPLFSSSVFISAVPAQFMWILDFFRLLFTNYTAGRNAWLINSTANEYQVYSSIIMHFILIPSALWALYRFGFNKMSILVAWLSTFFLLSVSYFLTDPRLNTNCVFRPCDYSSFSISTLLLGRHYPYESVAYLLQVLFDWFIYIGIFYILVSLFHKILRFLRKV